jgi:magnesium transporter
MILYYPIYNKEKRETNPRELDIILTKNVLITSHYRFILPLKALFDTCNLYQKPKKNYMSDSTGHLLFYILSSFWKSCLTKLDRIEKRLDGIEKEIFRGKEKEMVLEISLVKADIIDFWRIIEPQREIMKSISTEGIVFFGKELDPYFADVLGTYSQAWNEIKTYKETILALKDTNQSLLSTKTNEIMKVLTVFSVIMLPLTLLASIWGMNVPVPLSNSPWGFWSIVLLMILLVGFMLHYFRKRKWL